MEQPSINSQNYIIDSIPSSPTALTGRKDRTLKTLKDNPRAKKYLKTTENITTQGDKQTSPDLPEQDKPTENIDTVVNVEGTTANFIDIRKSFVKKVLVILFIQLGITSLFIGATFVDSLGVRHFVKTNTPTLIFMALLSFGSLIIIMCKRNLSRKVPYNYLLLFFYTCGMSYLVASLAAFTSSQVVLFAGVATMVIVFAILIYALLSKSSINFSRMLIIIFVLICLLLLGTGPLFTGKIQQIIFSLMITFLFGVYLAFSIKRLKDRYDELYSIDDYIIAALDIYINIVYIFVFMLEICRKCFTYMNSN